MIARTRRPALALALGVLVLGALPACAQDAEVRRYVRYEAQGEVSYGLLEGDQIRQLDGGFLSNPEPTGLTVALSAVRLLSPVDPDRTSKVIGVAVNTRRPSRMEPIPNPRWFAKFPTSLGGMDSEVQLPPEAGNLNYEGELVLIIGREARHVSEAEALDYVFGVTVGDDFSENTWYGERNGVDDPTRMISKGTDSWAPIGPAIVTGLDYTDLAVETRLNGEVVQAGRTSDLVNGVASLISHVSRYITLKPGDVIFTGTVLFVEGARRAMQAGDVVEVEIENLGVLRNRIVPMMSSGGSQP